ncbi:MAG: Ig-like domain-containing protein [Parcubacteria group bacterium]|jgi:hypothetical protein
MKDKKNKIMLKIFKLQLWITILFFLAYAVSIIFGGREVFLSDLINKKKVAGATVSAMVRIFGPPEKPLVSVLAHCNGAGLSVISLNWSNAVDATSYDIYRNGEEIANGLVDNFYLDNNIAEESNYSYYVIARGPAGIATSDTSDVLSQKCVIPEIPFVSIGIFEGKNLSNISGTPTTNNRKPIFSGSTNFENSLVEIKVLGNQSVFSSTQSNQNGFWQWAPLSKLSWGNYIIYVQILDSGNGNVLATNELYFKIKEDKSDGDEKSNSHKQTNNLGEIGFDIFDRTEPSKPFDFDISLENEVFIKGVTMVGEAYRGENIKAIIDFDSVNANNIPIEVSYALMDPDRKIVAQYLDKIILKEGLILEKSIALPFDLKLGKYKLKISTTVNNITVSNESSFILKDRPILKIGANTTISLNDLVSNLGWLAVASTSFLSFFSLLALWEYHLYKRATFHITENILKRKKFIN